MRYALLLLFAVSPVWAADHYIRDGGSASTSGTGACTTWETANACDQLPATLVRGDTYYIAGGTYTGRTFSTAESSTTLITIKGATVAEHGTDTGWSDAYSVASSQAVFSDTLDFGSTGYWVLDGAVSPASPLSSGASDPSNYGFSVTDATACSSVREAISTTSNNTFRNFAIVSSCGEGTTSACQFGVRLYNATTSNVTVSHWYAENNIGDFQGPPGNTAGVLIEYHYSKGQWSDPSCHGEVYAFGGTDATIRWNYHDQCRGTGCIASNGPDMTRWLVYGNVFNSVTNDPDSDPGSAGGNGTFAGASSIGPIDSVFHNNTVLQGGMTQWFYTNTGSGNDAKNNIVKWNCSIGSGSTHTYNSYRSCTDGTPSETGGDSLGSDPWVGGGTNFGRYPGATLSDFALTAATTAGASLSSPYDVDMLGNTRGADGNWDRGALEYVDGGESATTSRIGSGTRIATGARLQ